MLQNLPLAALVDEMMFPLIAFIGFACVTLASPYLMKFMRMDSEPNEELDAKAAEENALARWVYNWNKRNPEKSQRVNRVMSVVPTVVCLAATIVFAYACFTTISEMKQTEEYQTYLRKHEEIGSKALYGRFRVDNPSIKTIGQ